MKMIEVKTEAQSKKYAGWNSRSSQTVQERGRTICSIWLTYIANNSKHVLISLVIIDPGWALGIGIDLDLSCQKTLMFKNSITMSSKMSLLRNLRGFLLKLIQQLKRVKPWHASVKVPSIVIIIIIVTFII